MLSLHLISITSKQKCTPNDIAYSIIIIYYSPINLTKLKKGQKYFMRERLKSMIRIKQFILLYISIYLIQLLILLVKTFKM